MNKRIIPFIGCYIMLFAVSCFMLLTYHKAELHLLLNSWHSCIVDTFFIYYTVLAEWPLYVIGLLPVFFKRADWTKLYAICEIVGAIIITILKYIYKSPRPITYFESLDGFTLPLLFDPSSYHRHNSFPSGHSSTFFIFFTVCALLLIHSKWGRNNKKSAVALSILFLIAAALGAFSRVYLSQHFLLDITVGSFVGVVVTCLVFFFFGSKLIKK